jgi:hypothetical protein
MARPGPAPNNRRHGHGGAEMIDVVDMPYTGPGSDLDLPADGGIAWFAQVRAWWEQVRTMPHCGLWSKTDWLFALETAYLKQDFWQSYFAGELHATKATEIRRREDQMGVTREARRKIGIRYIPPPDNEPHTAAAAEAADEVGAGDDVSAGLEDARERRRRLAAG